ncbi:hypothetical protein NQ314_018761 [Rhamnusium bicolor]|uniref:Uncharacterized protein n=1 Tax=Rhamnusium bicolor TaxID=1586634 RepID=A0AAV8WPY4_9CUCU|nr:hypothetical protein NQ314_018761 [Rhamnusium bicolor]
MSDVVGTSINHEPFGVLESTKISNNAQEQEVNDLSEFLKLEHSKYLHYKVIYDTLQEYVSEISDTDKSLKTKVKDIMHSANVAQSIMLDDSLDESSTSIFRSCDINNLELNYTERNQLQDILKLKLDQKYKNICSEFTKLTNKDINKALESVHDTMPLQLSPEDKVLIDYKNKLIFEQEQYVKNLLSLQEVLKEITNLRLKELPQTTEQKIKECLVEEKGKSLEISTSSRESTN